MRVPSGDHTGEPSVPGSNVSAGPEITRDIDDPDVEVFGAAGSQGDGNLAFVW